MEQGEETGWWKELDLSAFSYSEFLTFFFDRPIANSVEEQYDLYRKGINSIIVSHPAVVLAYLRDMCEGFSQMAKLYSAEQLEQGLWGLLSESCAGCGQYAFDPNVEPSLRIKFIESMYVPFRDVVTGTTGDLRESSQGAYWMWWDFILHSLLLRPEEYERHPSMRHPSIVTADQKQIFDAIFQTLSKILALPHFGCQLCALHGLGHLHHPERRALVQAYIDEHGVALSEDDARYAEACRDGAVV